MTYTTTDRKAVATLANALRYQKGFTATNAWQKAWAVIKLKKQMSNGVAEFAYKKKDGSAREAEGTLIADLVTYESKSNGSRKYSPLYIRYYDLQKEAFRQFAAYRLL